MTQLADEVTVDVLDTGVAVLEVYLDLMVDTVTGGMVVDAPLTAPTVIETTDSYATIVDVYGGQVGLAGPTAVSADIYNAAYLGTDGLLYVPEGARMSLDVEVDESDSTALGFVYVGEATPGTAGSVAAWRIKRIYDSGTTISIEWAEGNADATQVWDNRKSLVYGP